MKAQLLAIDDVTLFPLKGEDVLLLFKLVNCVQGKTSLIIAASRDLTGWLEMAGDEVCAAALLDRLLYCCEIIRLSGKSYRMENRKTIFSNQQIGTAPQKGLMKVKKRTKESGYC
ncbi:ATP-binding protein, partial [Bacteroides fragilis]